LHVFIEVDLIAGISSKHVGDMPMPGTALPKGQAPFHEAAILRNFRPINLGQESLDFLHVGIVLPTEDGGGFEIIAEYLQGHELVKAVTGRNSSFDGLPVFIGVIKSILGRGCGARDEGIVGTGNEP
jgi:hypothetical protein